MLRDLRGRTLSLERALLFDQMHSRLQDSKIRNNPASIEKFEIYLLLLSTVQQELDESTQRLKFIKKSDKSSQKLDKITKKLDEEKKLFKHVAHKLHKYCGVLPHLSSKTGKQLENIFSRMEKEEKVVDLVSSFKEDFEALEEFCEKFGSPHSNLSQALLYYLVGTWFEKGQGVICDLKTAKFFYTKSTQLGFSLAYQAMGQIISVEADKEVEKIDLSNYEEVNELLKKKILAELHFSMVATLFPLQTSNFKRYDEKPRLLPERFIYIHNFRALEDLLNTGLTIEKLYSSSTLGKEILILHYMSLARIYHELRHEDMTKWISGGKGQEKTIRLLRKAHDYCKQIKINSIVLLPELFLSFIENSHFLSSLKDGHYSFLKKNGKQFELKYDKNTEKFVLLKRELLPLIPKEELTHLVLGYCDDSNNDDDRNNKGNNNYYTRFFKRIASSSSSAVKDKKEDQDLEDEIEISDLNLPSP